MVRNTLDEYSDVSFQGRVGDPAQKVLEEADRRDASHRRRRSGPDSGREGRLREYHAVDPPVHRSPGDEGEQVN